MVYQGLTPWLVLAHLDEEGGCKRLHNRLVQHHKAFNGSTHDRFGHEDIWLAKPIRIGHYAHNDVAQLLVKLVGMPLQILDVGHVFPDMGKEIDPSKGGLLSDVIGAKGNGQPITLFHALFQVSHQGTPDALALVADTHYQGMQFPHVASIVADATDPAQYYPVLIEGDPADAPCCKGFSHFLQSRLRVRPRSWPVGSKALHQQRCNLADG